jgi:hypothetical protein
MTTLKEVKEKLHFDSYSVKNGVFTVRKEFFYRMGKDTEYYRQKVLEAFPNVKIVDSGEVWKAFRGGASVANSSHWFVKFTFEDEDNGKV